MRRALPLAVMIASCGSEDAPRPFEPGSGIVAEVHLHQYAFGSHAAAGFLNSHVAYRRELDEQLVHFLTEPTQRDGDCRLDLPTRCSPTCDGATQYCELSQCRPYTPLRFLDAGPVVIRGSSIASPIELTFDARIPAYVSGRASTAPLFAAGDRLTIEVPRGAWSFKSEVIAPPMPEPLTPLKLPTSGPLRVEWKAVSSSIAIRISVAANTGASGSITCVSDVDRGVSVIPASLLARLPPAPRSVSWALERFERRFPRVAEREMAVVTVASTHVLDVRE